MADPADENQHDFCLSSPVHGSSPGTGVVIPTVISSAGSMISSSNVQSSIGDADADADASASVAAMPIGPITISLTASPTRSPSANLNQDTKDMRGISVFLAAKAGMSRVDAAKVNQVVYEMSKDSAHFKHASAQERRVNARIQQLQHRANQLRTQINPESPSYSPPVHAKLLHSSARRLASLQSTRALNRTWITIDLDAFYAAVELRDRPELRGKPVAVGGMGMICTSNYEARQFGVRAAMPGFIGKKLCPQLVFVKPDFKKYTVIAQQTRDIYAEYDPKFSAGSLDEAYMDVTDYLASHPDHTPESVGEEIRRRVFETTSLTASCGIACNRLLAKICSDINKPNGQYFLPSDLTKILDFMYNLPVRKVNGIGRVMERILNSIGIQICGDAHTEEMRIIMFELFSPTTSDWLLSATMGIGRNTHEGGGDTSLDNEEGEGGRSRKSISCERTFREINRWTDLETKCREISTSLAEDIARVGTAGKCVTLKLKTVDFDVSQRSITLQRWISSGTDLFKYAMQLLKEERDRLIAIKSKQFKSTSTTLTSIKPLNLNITTEVKTSSQLISPLRSNSQTTPLLSSSPSSSSSSSSSPSVVTASFCGDGIFRLRLMGIRLSSLKEHEHDDDKAASNGCASILKYVKVKQEQNHKDTVHSLTGEDENIVKHKEEIEDEIEEMYQVKTENEFTEKSIIDHSHTDEDELRQVFDLKGGLEVDDYSLDYYFGFSKEEKQIATCKKIETTADISINLPDEEDLLFQLSPSTDLSNLNRVSDKVATFAETSTSSSSSSSSSPSLFSPKSSTTSSSSSLSSENVQFSASSELADVACESSSPLAIVCPICSMVLGSSTKVSNSQLNSHIDRCINSSSHSVTRNGNEIAVQSSAPSKPSKLSKASSPSISAFLTRPLSSATKPSRTSSSKRNPSPLTPLFAKKRNRS